MEPQSSSKGSRNFSLKPPIKVTFNDNSAQPPVKKVKLNSPKFIDTNNRRQEVVIENEEINSNEVNWPKNSCIKYENCTFNDNIVNNFYSCENCKK